MTPAIQTPRSDGVHDGLGEGPGFRLWAVFGKDCLRDGMDPACALCYLGERIHVARCCLAGSRIPDLDRIDPEDCWLAIAMDAWTGTPADVRDAFEFFAAPTVLAVVARDAHDDAIRAQLVPLSGVLQGKAPQAWLDTGFLRAEHWPVPPVSSH